MRILLLLFAIGTFTGCRTYSLLGQWLSPQPAPSASPGFIASPRPGELTTDAAKRAQANAELLQEVYRVVFVREVGDRASFGSLVDSLNQGASIEGVYNGIAHSNEYRGLEAQNPGARPEALKFFAGELARVELELPEPREFTTADALPLAVLGAPPPASDLSFGKGVPSKDGKPDPAALASKYEAIFKGSSIYTLKRVLADETLTLLDFKKKDPAKLAQWYGAWAARMAGLGVDFGIELRNKADEKFHEAFALKMPYDRLLWEILNREHRALNSLHFKKAEPQVTTQPGGTKK